MPWSRKQNACMCDAIMRKFIIGERYPSGGMNEYQHRATLGEIFKFLRFHSDELMRFSPREFFSVISELYLNQAVIDRINT